MSIPVKFIDSASATPGTPVLTGQVGSLIALLDALLINGFGSVTLSSLVVAGGVATATAAAHGFPVNSVLLLAGATPSGLNGEKRAATTTSGTFTFDATGIADGTATGTITAKMAPAGWAKVFSGTNKAAYQALAGNRHFLRVVNDATIAANKAIARGFESMSDVDTGTNAFPTTVQQADATCLWKTSTTADATARPWRFYADDRMLYLCVKYNASYYNEIYSFGEIAQSFKVGDAYHTMITINTDTTSLSASNALVSFIASSLYVARSYSQIAGSVTGSGTYTPSGNNYSGGTGNLAFPNPADAGLYIAPAYLYGAASNGLRGVMAGLYQCWQNGPSTDGTIINNVTNMSGRNVLVQWTQYSSSQAVVAFDITGPWR